MTKSFGLKLQNVKLYPKEPRLFMIDRDGPVLRDLSIRGSRVQGGARRLVRVRTGKLLSTIRKNVGANSRFPYVEIIAGGKGARYAVYEHDGTPAHIIRARRKKSLRFIAGGQIVFRKQVRHPGTRGTFYLTRSLPLGGG